MMKPWKSGRPAYAKRAKRRAPREGSRRAAMLKALRAGPMTSSQLTQLSGGNAAATPAELRILMRKGLVTIAGRIPLEIGKPQSHELVWRLATATRSPSR